MASLSIAKATLLASCLRRDDKLESINRNELTDFHDTLEKTISTCTDSNVQKTTAWIVKHILPSSTRTLALSKYITSLSKHIQSADPKIPGSRPCRQQLHLAYIVNDMLHHAQYHSNELDLQRHTQEHIPPIVPHLFSNAVGDKGSRTTKRLQDLIGIWQKQNLCPREILTTLKEIVVSGAGTHLKSEKQEGDKQMPKESPWIMPATHGDPKAPYFDLPAANLMPHIVPNSSHPMRLDQIRPLHLNPGPADESLINALKDFLKDVRAIDNPYTVLEDEGITPEIDVMGQISYTNEANDPIGETYYGWSKAFCERMKTRDKDEHSSKNSRSRSRDRSYSRSVSGSRSPIHTHERREKRKRYSRSRSSSRSSLRGRDHRRHTPEPFYSKTESQQPTRLHTIPSAFPSQFQSAVQNRPHQPHPSRPPPAPTMNYGSGPFQLPPTGHLPPQPPNWPVNVPWPPPPPPPSQNLGFLGYGRR